MSLQGQICVDEKTSQPPLPIPNEVKAESSKSHVPTLHNEEEALCSICRSEYVHSNDSELRPVILVCGHTLCRGCWSTWKGCDHTKKDFGVDCPSCRCPILGRPVVTASGKDLTCEEFPLSVMIDPLVVGGKEDRITMTCTPLTTAASIIDYLDPLIKREFEHIAFPKKHLQLYVEVTKGSTRLARSAFINGYTLASIGICDSYTLRLTRHPIKAPHCLLDARLQLVHFKPRNGKFTIKIKSRTGFGKPVRMTVTKNTTLEGVREHLKRKFEASENPLIRKVAKRAKRIPIMGLECGEWDHSVTTLLDLRVGCSTCNNRLSYGFHSF